MTITISGTIDGLEEQILYDQIPNPGVGLFEAAKISMVASFKANSLRAAERYGREQAVAGAGDLPAFGDDDALITYYFASEGYKNAGVIATESLQAKIGALEARISRIPTEPSGDEEKDAGNAAAIDELQDQIDVYEAQITAIGA